MKAILSTIALIAAVLFVSVQYAEAEPLIIQAVDDDKIVSIMIDGEDSVVKYQSNQGSFEAWDSTIKFFKSGFMLKNSETGTVVFAHESDNDTWKLTVKTFQGWTKFIGFTPSVEEVDVVVPSERIEPKSSIGSDLSKWDVPTPTREDRKSPMLLAMRVDSPHSLLLGDGYELNGQVYNARTNQNLYNATVNVEISRDGYVIREITAMTGVGGTVRLQFDNLDYPEFYPSFCYQITAKLGYDGYETEWEEDFNIQNTKAGALDYSWLEQSQWNYLPNSFRNTPPTSLNADTHCNGM